MSKVTKKWEKVTTSQARCGSSRDSTYVQYCQVWNINILNRVCRELTRPSRSRVLTRIERKSENKPQLFNGLIFLNFFSQSYSYRLNRIFCGFKMGGYLRMFYFTYSQKTDQGMLRSAQHQQFSTYPIPNIDIPDLAVLMFEINLKRKHFVDI